MTASYSFVPWLRTGLAAGIARVDGTGAAEPRASVAVTLVVDAAGERRPVSASLPLAGPGEVSALDPRAVIRVAPKPGELDANPNELPMLEFGEPDLPWRFTPAVADAHQRVRPWLVLAVLAADEITDEAPASSDGRLPAITVASAAALPDLDQSWAWAHVHVDDALFPAEEQGFDGWDPATETLTTVDPRRLRGRLLAPRRLAPKSTYVAVLVPAFARGRLAGLREPLAETVDGLAPAWQATDTNIRLPLYFSWTFQTGQEADFEQLARRLRPHRAGPTVGLSRMDARTPDPALPAASAQPLEVVGALVSPDAHLAPWPAAEREAFTAALAALLNRPADAVNTDAEVEGEGTPIVGPPLWGGGPAARDRVDPTAGAQPRWFHELNVDPRLRVAAGLGAEVVRRNDEALMAAAWDQVEGILEANERLRRAQLAREVSARLQAKHLSTLDTDVFLQVTGPLHPRFRADAGTAASPATVAARLAGSPIPAGALDGGLRRTRARVARIARRTGGTAGALLGRLNQGEVRAQPPAPTAAVLAADLTPVRVVGRAHLPVRTDGVDVRAIGRAGREPLVADGAWRPGTSPGGPRSGGGHVPVPGRPDDPVAQRSAQLFEEAYADLFGEMVTASPRPGPVLRRADLASLASTLTTRMDPRLTIADELSRRLTIAPWVEWNSDDPLEPIMVAPEFDTPMYEPLRDLGPDWLLPGAGTIPSDAVTLVLSNQRFVEAYLAGLNHEMSRELLYHEYPTDQRGTYFRQFWDVRGHVDPAGNPPDPESTRDIRPMHTWPPCAALGANGGRIPPLGADQHLVLLIKAELFRRYPNTLVTASPAVIGLDGQRTLGEAVHHAIFAGRLEPDIAFFGFDLTTAQVRGSDTDPGWFFVLAEHPTEPRFGLDADNGEYAAPPTTWNDLNWAHTAANADDLDGLRYLDLDADLPDTRAVVADPGDPALAWHASRGLGPTGATAADLAWIMLQRPFRVAIHAVDLLPAPVSP